MLSFSATTAQRHYDHSRLTIRMWDRAFMTVSIGDRGYDAPDGVFRKQNISAGQHHITVSRRVGRHGHQRIVYRGSIYIPRNRHVIAKITKHNRLVVLEKRYIESERSYHNNRDYRQNNPRYDRPTRRYNMVNIPAVVSSMNRATFGSDKLIIAKQALRNSNIDAAGVERIMRQFSFDDARLEFATFAYGYCVDPENYYRVNNAFTFSSSIRKLEAHINSYNR